MFFCGWYNYCLGDDTMKKNGPILILEDDLDDQAILTEVFQELGYKNEIMFFEDGFKALAFLKQSDEIKPFIILSDINLPKLSGIELKEKIQNNEDLRMRCIPYLFLTTSSSHRDVVDAYSKSIQGFFIKPSSITEIQAMIKEIVDYWKICTAPNYIPT